jgi:MFS family permease
MVLFTEPAERAKAMGIFGFVLSGGGTAGVLLGGILTDVLNWHWIFLVNLPVGAAVLVLAVRLLPAGRGPAAAGSLDVWGAATVTASLVLAVYAIVNGNEAGWTSARTVGLLGAAVALLAAFLSIEARVSSPLMPLGLFRRRNIYTANAVGVLMACGMFAWFFFSALYLQQVLGYTPLEVGLAFLPSTVLWGAVSLLLSDKLAMRFGFKAPVVGGLALFVGSLVLFARAPVDGSFAVDILPATLLVGLGAGIAFNPLLLAAMSDVDPSDSGLASGVVNTAFMMGGALGLAVLASLASMRTDDLSASGEGVLTAVNGGFHLAFLVGAVFAAAAAALAATMLRPGSHATAHGGETAVGVPATAEAE